MLINKFNNCDKDCLTYSVDCSNPSYGRFTNCLLN